VVRKAHTRYVIVEAFSFCQDRLILTKQSFAKTGLRLKASDRKTARCHTTCKSSRAQKEECVLRFAFWAGPYSMASDFGGPISNFQYPYDENEDPFLFRY
jgi:hypothetical protein